MSKDTRITLMLLGIAFALFFYTTCLCLAAILNPLPQNAYPIEAILFSFSSSLLIGGILSRFARMDKITTAFTSISLILSIYLLITESEIIFILIPVTVYLIAMLGIEIHAFIKGTNNKLI